MILILKYFLYNAVLLLIWKQMKKSEINHVLLKCVTLLQTNHMVVCYLYPSLGNLYRAETTGKKETDEYLGGFLGF